MFQFSETWRNAYPGAVAGVLVMTGVSNPEQHAGLEERKQTLEQALRSRWAGQDRKALESEPVMQAYRAYYSRFRKTYHVLLQLESVALKGRSLPRVAALVEAMFMAELKNQLLTAGHDAAKLDLPVTIDIATGNESYMTLSGKDQALAAGDMYIRDGQGVMSSIVYGPDRRTPISLTTQRVMFTVYAPPGIGPERVRAHLNDIQEAVQFLSPAATVEMNAAFEAGPSAS